MDRNVFCTPCIQDFSGYSILAENSFHDVTFTSIAFNFEEPFDLSKLKFFLDTALRLSSERIRKVIPHPESQDNHGDDISLIYRMKGMIRIRDIEKLYILQSVHDVFDLQPSDYTGKLSSIIIIGFHLNANELRNEFRTCTVSKPLDSIDDNVEVMNKW